MPVSVVGFLTVISRVELRRGLSLSLAMSRVVFPEKTSHLTAEMSRVLHRVVKL